MLLAQLLINLILLSNCFVLDIFLSFFFPLSFLEIVFAVSSLYLRSASCLFVKQLELYPLLALFISPTWHDHLFYGVASGFTRLCMKNNDVCHGLVSPHVTSEQSDKPNNNFNCKNRKWGIGKKSPIFNEP